MSTTLSKQLALITTVLALSACSTPPTTNLRSDDVVSVNKQDRIDLRNEVIPIIKPLSLDEALARALKYNLERRTKMMEEALAFNQLDVSKLDMLPKLVAQAGYLDRSSERATLSSGYFPQTLKGPNSSISQERSHSTFDLGLTWSLLDYGVGYYNTQQQANRVLIAGEKRRKAMHLLMQDVRIAFWRAASAQKLRSEVEKTIVLAEDALIDSRKVEVERVRNPVDALRYQRQLLENLRLLESIDQELSSAQIELAALVNAPLSEKIQIEDTDLLNTDAGVLRVPVEAMEEAALAQNADLREQHYNARIAREETRKTMVRMYPNINFSYGFKYDSDSYLVHNNWNEAGLQLSFNILNILTSPTQIKLADAGVKLADQRRISTLLAVLTQVHISRLQLINARNQFERADAIYSTDIKIANIVRNRVSAAAQSKLDSVANATSAILSLLRRYQALAQVQSAENRLLATLGLEPKIGSTSDLTLEQLTAQIAGAGAPWRELIGMDSLKITPAIATPAASNQGAQ